MQNESSISLRVATNFTHSHLSLQKISFLGKYKNTLGEQKVWGREGWGKNLPWSLKYSIVQKWHKENPEQVN